MSERTPESHSPQPLTDLEKELLGALKHVTANLKNVWPRCPDPHERSAYQNSTIDAGRAISKATAPSDGDLEEPRRAAPADQKGIG